ncbi:MULTISPECIES: hypothetical protein [unclassified Microcoleus]|uniref:hypothetical protein n=1 Tax=unclassified Microcoleus TaxID=2642155 RepID=UPI002FD12591
MGKFDKIFNSEDQSEASLTLEESVAAVALVAAEANSPDTDADILESILWESEIFAEYSEDDMSAMFQRLAGIVAQDGLGALFNPHSAGSTIVREFFQLRWHSSSREKIIFTARSAKELENPQSFLRQIGNVLDTINCQ